jgi:hypothetical protein
MPLRGPPRSPTRRIRAFGVRLDCAVLRTSSGRRVRIEPPACSLGSAASLDVRDTVVIDHDQIGADQSRELRHAHVREDDAARASRLRSARTDNTQPTTRPTSGQTPDTPTPRAIPVAVKTIIAARLQSSAAPRRSSSNEGIPEHQRDRGERDRSIDPIHPVDPTDLRQVQQPPRIARRVREHRPHRLNTDRHLTLNDAHACLGRLRGLADQLEAGLGRGGQQQRFGRVFVDPGTLQRGGSAVSGTSALPGASRGARGGGDVAAARVHLLDLDVAEEPGEAAPGLVEALERADALAVEPPGREVE